MNNIIFKIKKAKYSDIVTHLLHVDCYFTPHLSHSVDLDEFSVQIFNNTITVEAWHEKKLIGLLSAYFNDISNIKGFINHIAVFEDYQKQGISKILLRECIKYGVENNFQYLALEVAQDNIIAMNLYFTLGFQKGTIKDNKIIMKKMLKGELE